MGDLFYFKLGEIVNYMFTKKIGRFKKIHLEHLSEKYKQNKFNS